MARPTRVPGAVAAAALLLSLAACGDRAGPAVTAPPPAANRTAPEYVIGPGDTLTVFVYRAPELSASALPVRPDGRLSLPLVPDVQAAGTTPTGLARELEKRLGRYVREPNVTVMVQSFIGPADKQVRVIGEAAQPLALPYREGMTVLDVMISSRGLTRYAAGNRAEIVRRRPDGPPETLRVRLSDLLRDGDVSQDVAMQPGDTLIIPQSWF